MKSRRAVAVKGWCQGAKPSVLLAGLAVLFGVASGLVAGVAVWADHTETLRRTEAATQDLARLLEEHAHRTIDAAELMVERLADRGRPQAGAQAAMAAMLQGAPHLSDLYLLDAEGRLVADARGVAAKGASFADRAWLKTLRAGGRGAVIAPVAYDESGRGYSFAVARRIDGSDGAA
ncbi:MAG: hypothetical protein HY985_14075, partial [Magnetospirillum sp.]|nr:hypothetical protein [Magnetospirillum sp.]